MTLKVLTIGAGFFAQLHVEAWSRNTDTTLIGLVDQDQTKAQRLAEQYAPKAQVISDAAHAIATTSPDIIDIATPPDTHESLIKLADKAAPKAIICQKPFCGTRAAARKATATTSSLLIVHENFRFQPWYRQMQTYLDAGTFGDLYQISVRFRPGDGQGPNAYLARQPYFRQMKEFLVHETAIHWIDTFRYLMGEPSAVYADLRRLNETIKGEDAGHILFNFPNGQRALFDGNRLADHPNHNPRLTMGDCTVEGSKGTLTLDGFGQLSIRMTGETTATLIPTDYNTSTFGGDCVYAFQRHVSNHLLHGEPLENTAKDYLRNIEIEEKIYQAATQNRALKL